MNPNKRSYLVLGIMLLLLTLIFAVTRKSDTERIRWNEHYRTTSEDPYGLKVLYELMPSYFPNQEMESLDSRFTELETGETRTNYLFVGSNFYPDSAATGALLDFIAAGNTAFISAKSFPFEFFDALFPGACERYSWPEVPSVWDTVANVRITHPNLGDTSNWTVRFRVQDIYLPYGWAYLPMDLFCDEYPPLDVLGQLSNHQANYLRMPYGEGHLLLHSAPILFTNYFLKERRGYDYSSAVFSHLDNGPIYWDNYTAINSRSLFNPRNPDGRSFNDEGPLSFILSSQALSWAWYLLLGGGLLYLFFRAKRRQRIIPVLEPNRNTSLDFITNIGRLYFLRPNHRKLAITQMQLLLQFVRDRYHLHGRDPDPQFVKTLAIRSGVEQEKIESIVKVYQNIEGSQFLSENALIAFHQKLEDFYRTCK
jgi:hypothetical protein